MVNVGIIGCGKIAQVRHLPEYADNPSARIIGVYDINRARAEEIGEKYHTRVYESYEEMLENSEIDAVSICTANFSHCEIAVRAMEAGKHVLCEKPMAVTYEDCRRMVDTARKTGRFLMVGHNQRLTKTHKKARDLIAHGEIGRVITFKSSFAHSGPENWTVDRKNVWFFDKKAAAFGAMADLGIHKTDLIQFLTGKNILEAFALTGTLDKKDQDGNAIGVDDNAICIYKLESGILGTVTVSWSNYGAEDNSTILYGTEGCMKIYCDPEYSIVVEKKDGQRVLYDIDRIQTNDNQSKSGVIDSWISCLEKGNPPEISGEDAFNAMKAVFAALQSAQTGRMVTVKELENQ